MTCLCGNTFTRTQKVRLAKKIGWSGVFQWLFRQKANSSSWSLHCAQNGAVLWESGEGGHGHRLGSLWCGGHVAAGEEAIDEEEARLERSVRAAWQPAAPRHQRFLQKVIEGKESWMAVTTSWSVGTNGAFALADVVPYHWTKCHLRARRWLRRPASSRGNQQERW